jgi:hypothetical protein
MKDQRRRMKDKDNGEAIPCLDSVRSEFTGVASRRKKGKGRRERAVTSLLRVYS